MVCATSRESLYCFILNESCIHLLIKSFVHSCIRSSCRCSISILCVCTGIHFTNSIAELPLPRRNGLCPLQCAAAEHLPQQACQSLPSAQSSIYKSPIHIHICIRALIQSFKRATLPSAWEGVGLPTPSFPLPNAPPKHGRGQMCEVP